jgi:signal peptide peptidase SppA
MKAPLIHVASMVFNEPLAIIPEKLEAILRAIGPRLVVDDDSLDELLRLHSIHARPMLLDNAVMFDAQAPVPQSRIYENGTSITIETPGNVGLGGLTINGNGFTMAQLPEQNGNGEDSKPYRLTPEGIAVIPVRGTLMKRFGFLSMASGCSSYASLAQAATAALEDLQVKAILFDVDSPGGTTHGCFELSDMLYQMRGDKPMWAVANDLAASAAYALASAADRIWVTRTAGVGSVGVFALHADQSGLDEQSGVKYTYVFAGNKKTDGNPHEPLSKSAKADIQVEVDREYDMFVATVARNRGFAGADAKKVQATEAAVFFAESALPLLADEVGTFDEALEALTQKVNGSKGKTSGKLALQPEAGNNAPETGAEMPAIAPHHTATSDKPWDGPRAKKNLRQGEDAGYYRSAYAFAKPAADPKTKAGYTFIHHEVSSGGDVGAANIKGCQSSIGILNGGRSGTVLGGSDRKGVYNHVAAHLRDAKLEPAPLATYQEYLAGVLAWALEKQNKELHATALDLLRGTEGEPEGEEAMAKSTEDMKRAKKDDDPEAAAAAAAADKKDDQDDDDEEDDDDRPPKEDAKSKKDDDEGKARRGSVTELPLAANSAAKRIAELCQIAGAPELAADYIMKGYNVDKVIEKLSARRAKASAEGGVSSYVSGDVGSGGGGARASVDNAIEQARIMSANSGGKLTQSQCMEKLLRANPDIYSGYLEERGAVAAQVAFTGGGRALTEYVLNHQRRYMSQLGLSTVIEDVPGHRPM